MIIVRWVLWPVRCPPRNSLRDGYSLHKEGWCIVRYLHTPFGRGRLQGGLLSGSRLLRNGWPSCPFDAPNTQATNLPLLRALAIDQFHLRFLRKSSSLYGLKSFCFWQSSWACFQGGVDALNLSQRGSIYQDLCQCLINLLFLLKNHIYLWFLSLFVWLKCETMEILTYFMVVICHHLIFLSLWHKNGNNHSFSLSNWFFFLFLRQVYEQKT